MTGTGRGGGAATATLPVVTALLDKASRRGERSCGVLGIRARPVWDGRAAFSHGGLSVVVAPCVSALAVREALLDRPTDGWLVVLTDRDERDLGTGITAHLAGERLRTPDPWDAVRDRFAATRLDHRLVSAPDGRQLATGLLSVGMDRRWPPAPGGMLTLDHAYAAVAAAELGVDGAVERPDLTAVLRWTTSAGATARVADLRATAGDAVAGAVLDWLADGGGRAAPLLGRLLATGRLEDVVPLGLAVRAVLPTPATSGPWALLRRLVATPVTDDQAAAYATAAEGVARDLLREDGGAGRVLARADALVAQLEASAQADTSDLLRSGLTARLESLGEALRRCGADAATRAAYDPGAALVDPTALEAAEAAWARVERHALAAHLDRDRCSRALDGVRLARWLGRADTAPADLPGAVARHRDEDAWVDLAYADAWNGVADPSLAAGLRAVLDATRLRRDAHDRAFGAALARHQGASHRLAPPTRARGVVLVEDLLAEVVLPIARNRPVLLVVADGMSAAAGTEVVDDVGDRYDAWLECLPTATGHRYAALAALPSLTDVSRACLLTGTLTTGQQPVERAGFERLLRSAGVAGRLFHKLSLEATGAGRDLAPEIGSALDDAVGTRLVACVLNTIDDALDRSDPGGTDWTADAVKHLTPLLDRARRSGRVVVLTSDHGHVVERREGRVRAVAGGSGNRWRPYAAGTVVHDDEVRVRGTRVLLGDGDVVLAVDERLRYGPIKAGYHGGAAPAEVVIPVHVLVPGDDAPPGWEPAPPLAPTWWRSGATRPVAAPAPSATVALPATTEDTPALFDALPAVADGRDLAAAVLASPVYREQRRRAARVPIDDEQVRALLRALDAAPAGRLDEQSAAAALGVAVVRLSGALANAQRLLNVEQYAVLERDPDTRTVVLDVDLLREQFGLG